MSPNYIFLAHGMVKKARAIRYVVSSCRLNVCGQLTSPESTNFWFCNPMDHDGHALHIVQLPSSFWLSTYVQHCTYYIPTYFKKLYYLFSSCVWFARQYFRTPLTLEKRCMVKVNRGLTCRLGSRLSRSWTMCYVTKVGEIYTFPAEFVSLYFLYCKNSS